MIQEIYNKKSILKHLGTWALVMLLLCVIDPINSDRPLVWIVILVTMFVGYTGCFYTTTFFILNCFWENNKLAAVLSIALLYCLFSLYMYLYNDFILPLIGMPSPLVDYPLSLFLENTLYLFFILMVCSMFYYGYLTSIIELHKKNEMLYMEKNFIKYQFDTHLTKNFLTVLSEKMYNKAPEAVEFIDIYTDLLKFSLQLKANQKIYLKQEIDYIENYIQLQKIMYQNVEVNINYTGDLTDKQIYPRLIITLIENAFLHGVKNDPEHPIKIDIDANDTIQCRITNRVDRINARKSTGVGTHNMIATLKTHYPGKHNLHQCQENNIYKCKLTLG